MSESADEAEYAQETPDAEEEASEHGQDSVVSRLHDSTLLLTEADVKEDDDERRDRR